MTEEEINQLGFEIVRNIHEASGRLATLADMTSDIEVSDNYVHWANWFRDWADQFFPPKEDWPDKVIRFPHERVR